MPRTVALDQQYFSDLRENDLFYIDKTAFIREWWNSRDRVTLITRPRRFGKTLMMSTVESFFSTKYAGRSILFDGLDIWKDETFRSIQGTYPVIFLSLASVKGADFTTMRKLFCQTITEIYTHFEFDVADVLQNANEREQWNTVRMDMDDAVAASSLHFLSKLLHRAHGRKPIILLDEYDTPLQEAWVKGFWSEMLDFLRVFFNATFKTNPSLERALLTGITRVGKELLFSDFNNIRIVSTSSDRYATSFGFTEQEVFAAMDEYGLADREGVKAMYDGFSFGSAADIYNPWSVLCYLQEARLEPWWSNTSSNALAGKLVREGGADLKQDFMKLLEGGTITSRIDEQVVFDQLSDNAASVWSLLMASGYLKPVRKNGDDYELALTNGEVRKTLEKLVSGWFDSTHERYNAFLQAMLEGDLDDMNEYMNDISLACFSYFDTGKQPGRAQPERFYHGFVLGLLVDLRGRYIVTSNGVSGRGRYDVMLEPCAPEKDFAFVIEFKVRKPKSEATLEDTVAAALSQIREKAYEQRLIEHGIPAERIHKYGFAFDGQKVLIGE